MNLWIIDFRNETLQCHSKIHKCSAPGLFRTIFVGDIDIYIIIGNKYHSPLPLASTDIRFFFSKHFHTSLYRIFIFGGTKC